MPYQPKHRIEVAWPQRKKRWKHQAVQPQGDQTHHDRHDLPIVVARFGRIKSPHPSASDEYHPQDLVHGIGEKPSSTDYDGPCRADTPKERFNEVAGKVFSSRVRHVAFTVAIID